MSAFQEQFDSSLKRLRENPPAGFKVENSGMYREDGGHATGSYVLECIFAAQMLHESRAKKMLDIGSYRLFTIGLCANADTDVTLLEIRDVPDELAGSESRIIGDAKDVELPENYFDAVVSLCALEHFGLGKYGEDFDIDADTKAIKNIKRCLKPGGSFIFTCPVGDRATIWFNAHRVYSLGMLRGGMSQGFEIEKERFINIGDNPHFFEPVNGLVGDINWYCGAWRKSA